MMHAGFENCRNDLHDLLVFCFTNKRKETNLEFEERLIQHLSKSNPWPANLDPDPATEAAKKKIVNRISQGLNEYSFCYFRVRFINHTNKKDFEISIKC